MAKNTKDIVTPEIKVKNPVGRQRIYNAESIAYDLDEYIDITDEPLIQEFCINKDISRDTLYRLEKENSHLSDSIKKALEKQEAYIIRNASTGKINPVFSIFRLKQKCFGYTDKTELDIKPVAPDLDKGQLQATLLEMLDDLPPDQRQKLLSNGE